MRERALWMARAVGLGNGGAEEGGDVGVADLQSLIEGRAMVSSDGRVGTSVEEELCGLLVPVIACTRKGSAAKID